ncbi:MAG: hypothetical protein WCA35_15005, partial [Kovacikia sp.]
PIFDTVSTQAFQLGYLMSVHSIVEAVLEPGTTYEKRIHLINFVSELFINALNTYFSSGVSVDHRTLTGFVNESRVRVFDQNQLSLRRLLSFRVKELNERQWVFFRYAILEMVHCKYAYQSVLNGLNNAEEPSLAITYRGYLPELIEKVLNLREQYVSAAIRSALNNSAFELEIKMLRARLQGEGKLETEIDDVIKEKESAKQGEVREECMQNISTSLGESAKADKIVSRLIGAVSVEQDDGDLVKE